VAKELKGLFRFVLVKQFWIDGLLVNISSKQMEVKKNLNVGLIEKYHN
jgi:hypothetical protein